LVGHLTLFAGRQGRPQPIKYTASVIAELLRQKDTCRNQSRESQTPKDCVHMGDCYHVKMV